MARSKTQSVPPPIQGERAWQTNLELAGYAKPPAKKHAVYDAMAEALEEALQTELRDFVQPIERSPVTLQGAVRIARQSEAKKLSLVLPPKHPARAALARGALIALVTLVETEVAPPRKETELFDLLIIDPPDLRGGPVTEREIRVKLGLMLERMFGGG